MGRPRVIDKNKLLDAAESVISEIGASAFSIDAVAQAANVTKGGVQYAFGTKDALINAMIDRWANEFDEKVAAIVGPSSDPIELIRGHVVATSQVNPEANSKTAGLMAAMVQRLERREHTRSWYKKHFDGLDLTTPEGRRARLAFLAAEGVFLLRGFGYMSLRQADWDEIMADIAALLLGPDVE